MYAGVGERGGLGVRERHILHGRSQWIMSNAVTSSSKLSTLLRWKE